MKSLHYFAILSTIAFASQSAAAQQPAPSPTPTATPVQTTYVRPSGETRRKNYFRRLFGIQAMVNTTLGAGIGTATNSPEEWGGQWEGFGKRLASGYATRAIRETTVYGLDETFKLDSSFYRSRNRSTGSRVRNAVISPFTARRSNGNRTIGTPRLIGTYTAAVISRETWYPRRFDYKDGLKSGSITLGFGVLYNLFREFVR